MGACLSQCVGTAPTPRAPTRQRSSRAATMKRSQSRGNSTHGNGSARAPPVIPDFGVGAQYTIIEMLGEGGTGQTWMCQDVRTARRVAIKFIPRPLAKVLVPMVSGEIELQARLSEGHLGLVRLETVLLTRSHLGLVMEYVDGGTLTQYVSRRAAAAGRSRMHLSEDEARYFFKQLISAMDYLHKSHVAHRDLKMCNVVLTQRRPPGLKLCDFGFAKGWEDDSHMNTRIGTPVYMSPQLIESKSEGKAYSATASDVWAAGVMLFAMLLGMFPYDHAMHPNPNSSGAHDEVWTEQMRAGGGNWQNNPRVSPHVATLSEPCRDMLDKLLEIDETKRINIKAIRQHPWFTQEQPGHLDEAWKELEQKQSCIERALESAPAETLKLRAKAVHDLVVLAGRHDGDSAAPAASDGAAAVGNDSSVRSTTRCNAIPESPGERPGAAEGEADELGNSGSGALPGAKKEEGGKEEGGKEARPAMKAVRGARWVGGPGEEMLVVELATVAQRTKSGALLPSAEELLAGGKGKRPGDESFDEEEEEEPSGAAIGGASKGSGSDGSAAPVVLAAAPAALAAAAGVDEVQTVKPQEVLLAVAAPADAASPEAAAAPAPAAALVPA